MNLMSCHIIGFFAGFLLDLIVGDPSRLPHPVRFLGWVIKKLENRLYGKEGTFWRGAALTVGVLLITFGVFGGILTGAYLMNPICGVIAETIMTCQILATKCLKTESMKVYDRLAYGTIEEARTAVSMIVGRDTKALDEDGVIRAAVETVAENTSDGVIAPMLYLAAGGPVLGFLYKAVNTMDSMIGYKNDRYLYFGRAAARLDDVVNFIPARISAFLMIMAVFLMEKTGSAAGMSTKNAYRIYKRDRRNHKSPNSAQTESVCAGGLGIRLAGDASYFGKIVKKPYIGDALRPAKPEDIKRANVLLYITAMLCEGICLLGLACILWCTAGC